MSTTKLPSFKQYMNFLGQAKEFLNLKDEKYLRKLKIRKRGGYPRGTRKGDGGIADQANMLGEALDSQNAYSTIDDKDNPVDNNSIDEEQDTDPNKMGLIRRVANAHLVYKRQTEDGTFSELWLYFDNVVNTPKIRSEILAGTDIDVNTGYSEDRSQSYEVWAPGTCEMMKITGLPS